MICGGHSGSKPADDDIRQICVSVQPQVHAHLNETFSVFEPESYTSQVVAGTNFTIRVHVGENSHLSVRVFRALPCNGGALEVTGVERL